LDQFYLYGHSWGGMLAIEYGLKYGRHLKALVISNMTASIASYVTYIDVRRRQLSPEMIRTLAARRPRSCPQGSGPAPGGLLSATFGNATELLKIFFQTAPSASRSSTTESYGHRDDRQKKRRGIGESGCTIESLRLIPRLAGENCRSQNKKKISDD
jgi:pimeloyl-ACP methyl ester carboxylesterase